ncbi:lipoyl(octanoyl) transferase LipB [Brevibacterium sp. GP-SGM9]|uniref:lipoyl(octanoyl) transferase LipB n=1 Tax=unclassified Brevibacterium TaxID=2614124 RepID=UPI001E5E6AE0|nr:MULTISPECIES: lipoyl(octanoyl) transferase LipB [unclassified Brevibacterium]MCD1284801.1 lipoate--protein ligase B [Brevibacterium sp. CCUG 69071]MDK8435578.1 lipoyl(octanoyl) transferase LipB [Brevibacterium sp. H-BE7]
MPLATEVLGFAPVLSDYRRTWDLQKRYHEEVLAGSRPSTILLLEHSPVYTAGKRTEDHERPTDGTEVVDVDRGGKITWHGPGQLVAYFIYKLNDPKEVRLFVSQLEDAMIALLAEYGIAATTVEGRAGVWLLGDELRRDRKIGAIGIRIHEGVTMHGLALNCSNDLGAYDAIVPCGIPDADTTTISAELGRPVTPEDVAARLDEILHETITA